MILLSSTTTVTSTRARHIATIVVILVITLAFAATIAIRPIAPLLDSKIDRPSRPSIPPNTSKPDYILETVPDNFVPLTDILPEKDIIIYGTITYNDSRTKLGYVDYSGVIILDTIYDNITRINNTILANISNTYFVFVSGSLMYITTSDMMFYLYNDHYLYSDNTLYNLSFSPLTVNANGKTYYVVNISHNGEYVIYDPTTGLYGMYKDNIKLEPTLKYLGQFVNGLALGKDTDNNDIAVFSDGSTASYDIPPNSIVAGYGYSKLIIYNRYTLKPFLYDLVTSQTTSLAMYDITGNRFFGNKLIGRDIIPSQRAVFDISGKRLDSGMDDITPTTSNYLILQYDTVFDLVDNDLNIIASNMDMIQSVDNHILLAKDGYAQLFEII